MVEEKHDGLEDLRQRLHAVKIKDIMTTSVITTTPETTLVDLAHLVIEKKVSGVPVCGQDGSLIGIITTTDLFVTMDMIRSGKVVVGDKIAIGNPTVQFAMSTDVVSVGPEASLDELIDIMITRNAHTFPIVEEGKLVGVVGRRDVLKNFYIVVGELFEA